MDLKERIEILFTKQADYTESDFQLFVHFREELEKGNIRSAENRKGIWETNIWVKKGILLGFRMGKITEMNWSNNKVFRDKNTYPERIFEEKDSIRLVPGGSSIRTGVYIAPNVTIMPPSFVNVGAYVDEGTMLDSHSLVGSCAQIGKNVHLSAAAIIGGVLEPIGNSPVIIEDEAFIGGNCGIYEGVIIKSKAIIAAGVIITAATKVYDAVHKKYLGSEKESPLTIPERAVVVSGNRLLRNHDGISIYCPVIIKYRDRKSENSVVLEDWLR